ncbi:hypothetical protein LX36DRAFT_249315 [Colletotrichum falcatum]|nr:hypothetical protein LX36DRAFT_249315 [Colletotrichum falcatum]
MLSLSPSRRADHGGMLGHGRARKSQGLAASVIASLSLSLSLSLLSLLPSLPTCLGGHALNLRLQRPNKVTEHRYSFSGLR